LVVVLIAATGGLGGYLWWQRRQPVVTGELYLVRGASFQNSQPVIELDSFKKSRLTAGPPPADIPLTGADSTFTFRAASSGTIFIDGPLEVTLNGHPLQQEQPLADNDIIAIGSTMLRYENLRLSAERRTPQSFELLKPFV
jgi:hypothetical protein